MAKLEQNAGGPNRTLRCDQCEELLADAVDGTLNAVDTAAFTRHQEQCALCAQLLRETQQGKAWMAYLAEPPAAPDDLTQRILARTSGLAASADAGISESLPASGVPAAAVPAWRRLSPGAIAAARQVLEPRLMMTVAMAFFSIALTLNLTGIKLSEVRAADLEPARLRANVTRQYYSTNEQVMKYYANLRVVYEMEARVRELRRITETAPAPRSNQPSPADAPTRQTPRDGSASPTSRTPNGQAAPAGDAKPQDQDRRTHLKRETVNPSLMVRLPSPSRLLSPAGQLAPLTVRYHPGRRQGIVRTEAFTVLPAKTVNPGNEIPGSGTRAERNQV